MADDQKEKDPENCDEMAEAVRRTGDEEKGRQQFLIKRAVDLGCVDCLPDHWEVKVSE